MRKAALVALLVAAPVMAQPAAPPRQAVVLTPVENMYSGPDERRDIVSQALLGQVVEVVEAFDGFLKVQTPDRYLGWMPRGAVLVYDGVDCSGLVSQVYWANGVTLPRDADLQFDDPGAAPVDKAQLRPGDLVFFGTAKVTHVGMYVGDGRFIDATTYTTPMVREDSLDDPHWTALYRGARRPGAGAPR